MAKRNITNPRYETVNKLPNSAKTVSQYAEEKGFSTNYLYKLIRTGKNTNFKIVVFNTINFIIPS